MITIRPETPKDYDAVRHVIVDAFTECEFGHNGEAELVDLLRNQCESLLSLVATEGDEIVGHILFSPVSVCIAGNSVCGMGLAPMAVAPNRQKCGIGSALVQAGLNQLIAISCSFVVVLGHPEYYPRFGFQPGSQYGISHGFAGIPQDFFFVNLLDQKAGQAISPGIAKYREEFGQQLP